MKTLQHRFKNSNENTIWKACSKHGEQSCRTSSGLQLQVKNSSQVCITVILCAPCNSSQFQKTWRKEQIVSCKCPIAYFTTVFKNVFDDSVTSRNPLIPNFHKLKDCTLYLNLLKLHSAHLSLCLTLISLSLLQTTFT